MLARSGFVMLSIVLVASPASAQIVRTGSTEIDLSTYVPLPRQQPDRVRDRGASGLIVNFMLNPGFESGSLAPWTTQNWTVTKEDSNSGDFSAQNVGNFSIEQVFTPVDVLNVIEVSLYSRQPTDGAPGLFAVRLFYEGSEEPDEVLVMTGTDWTYYDLTPDLRADGNMLEKVQCFGYFDTSTDPDVTRIDDLIVMVEFVGGIFLDGFESGDLSAWSTAVP